MGKIKLGKIAITFALTIMICLPHYAADNISSTKGDDTLIGGPGNDIYIYHKGDGNDTIIDPGG
ncbi:MAG: hypothetical protein WCR55_14925 [Lentisphaerota bacterium]